MKLNTMYVARSGESLRVIKLTKKSIHLSIFESEYVMDGHLHNFKEFCAASGMKEVDEKEYKKRVVAMRLFQMSKNDFKYPHKDYRGEYEALKKVTEDSIEALFNFEGGFKDYSNEEFEVIE